MTRTPIRLPRDGESCLDIFGGGRANFGQRFFTRFQIDQIARTVKWTPEVMVKVTGGGGSGGGARAHMKYISRDGTLEIETDDGRLLERDEQKLFLDSWHLDLITGQYRKPDHGEPRKRKVRLTYNVVLSMPSPTPPEKVLEAARKFARKKFAGHRYGLVLHTDQKHPHVHLVVKAENEVGKRLRIDKAALRDWREEFAHQMREQGVAANATRRAARGKNKRTNADGIFRAQTHGISHVLFKRVKGIVENLHDEVGLHDPARDKLEERRKSIVAQWMTVANVLDKQGELSLAGDVRYFAKHLPLVLTDRQQLSVDYVRHRDGTAKANEQAV
jgi:hypothetical protein